MWADCCFYLSVLLLAGSLIAAVRIYRAPYQRGRFLSPVKCVLAGVFLAAVLLFLPLHLEQFPKDFVGGINSVLLSIHSTMRLFVLDGEFDGVLAFTSALPDGVVRTGYSVVAAVLYVLAPALTFGFVLSFFKNISAYRSLLFHYGTDVYVFSELNEQALVLARSIQKKDRRCLLVFMDVFENHEESIFELCEKARELKAVCFKKDIVDISWNVHSKRSCVSLFAIGENESENIEQSIKLVEAYKNLPNFRLYVFSTRVESEVLFQTAVDGGMRVRRVNVIRSLISQTLYREGGSLFEGAIDCGTHKLISVVLIGLGRYGTEMLKALSWFCQMDGYQVKIHVFDQRNDAEERFTALCPELMAPERNGTATPGEAQYHIVIHGGMDVQTARYADCFHAIRPISHVFVALGDDGRNVEAAINARIMCERQGQHPTIQTIVYDPLKKKALEGITDYRGNRYRISFIGDLNESYSQEVILDSELEQAALERHLKWGTESAFWAYEFNYRSSVAAAIHLKMRILCGIPGASKKESELTPEERRTIEELEHRRWNAYMRSEGYRFSGSVSPESRNDLAKLHHDLVPFVKLSEEEKRKDSRVGTA